MPIILARTAGFCYGVRRAVKLALNVVQKDSSPLVTIGPLIHNQQAIDLLQSHRISSINDPSSLTKKDRVLIRAHGIPPDLREDLETRCAEVFDATCPHVTTAQRIVERHSREGFAIIIIGDRGHAEVEGLLGYAGGNGYVVESDKDVENLPILGRICMVSQTTQDLEHFRKLSELIKKRFPDTMVFETICHATSLRQKELMEIARKADVVVIVGGRTSANTKRLVGIARNMGTRTVFVETADELKLEEFRPDQVIGITAGASTPHWVIRNVVETLTDHLLKSRFILIRITTGVLRFLIYSSLLLGFSAGILTYSSASLMGRKGEFLPCLLAFLFVLSMHLINKRLSLPRDEHLLYGSQKRFAHYKDAFTLLALFSIGLSLVAGFFLGKGIFTLVLFSVLLGLVYSMTLLPEGLAKYIRQRRLMDIPGSKDIFMALAWGMVVVFIPYLVSHERNRLGLFFTFLLVLVLVLHRSLLLDVRDIEGDISLGKETIPILLGPKGSQALIQLMKIMIFLVLVSGWAVGAFPILGLLLLLILPYLFLHYPLSGRQFLYQSLVYDGFLEGQFLLAGMITLVWEIFLKTF
jgi:4-hydroxy-3-methylbut-2-enyl diphosphate reductase